MSLFFLLLLLYRVGLVMISGFWTCFLRSLVALVFFLCFS